MTTYARAYSKRLEEVEQVRRQLSASGELTAYRSPTIAEDRFGYIIQSGDRYLLSPVTKQWTKEKAGAYVFRDVGEANRTAWPLAGAHVVALAPKEEG